MDLDPREIERMRARYSPMRDDELAYIVSSRTDALTGEARLALADVLRTRGNDSLCAETSAPTGEH